ncbi:hypothetical protein ASPCADRAFT_518218 [Aspergillus carbonarius ITEM 5010]|uniref:Uncharacterized protein n=1 Tax=Aspergillus carbonarius (strain ITEM 5010) TaxID=602072 RepID=A0A1R3RBE3_ASPC5|nr:hypothetical protein ASPCADRAFT_518218 [Aspergillus carbonarius ITEM 5010]
MTSRAFSTSARQLRKLNWKFNGTTEDVTWITESMDDIVDVIPGLESVESGQVNGNPHATPSKNDPYHASVELQKKGGKPLTSAHVYPNGYVKFSKEKFGAHKASPHPKAPVIPPAGPADFQSVTKANKSSSQSEKK